MQRINLAGVQRLISATITWFLYQRFARTSLKITHTGNAVSATALSRREKVILVSCERLFESGDL